MSNESRLLDVFRTELQIQGRDFVCATVLPASSVTISFIGIFQGQSVIWKMTLATLSFWQESNKTNFIGADNCVFNRAFIDIDDGNEGVFPIRVGLDLDLIDEPVIRKSIIMVRNYKRLALGRSGFGSMPT